MAKTMKISKRFGSTYLKASDLDDDTTVTVADVTEEEVGEENKLVLQFEEKVKPMIVNKTNGLTIAEMFGDEPEKWVGETLTLVVTRVDYNGRMQDGIRVKRVKAGRGKSPSGKVETPPVDGK